MTQEATQWDAEARAEKLFDRIWLAREPERGVLLAQAEAQAVTCPSMKGHLAFYLLAHGQARRALPLYRELAQAAPDNVDVLRYLGHALAECGEAAQATQLLRGILRSRSCPDHEAVATRLYRLAPSLEFRSRRFWARLAGAMLRMTPHPLAAGRALRELCDLWKHRQTLLDQSPSDWLNYLEYYAMTGYRWPLRSCDLCGCDRQRSVYLNRVNRIVRCEACGLLHALRIPLEGFDVEVDMYQQPACVEKMHEHLNYPDWRESRERVLDTLLPGWREASAEGRTPRVFEIGAARGDMLLILRDHGWEVDGIEVDGGFVREAKQCHDIDLRTGTLNDLDSVPVGEADLVLAFHVIEHLDQPSRLFDAASRLLRPNGVFIAETPTTLQEEVSYATRCNPFEGFDALGHVYFFTDETLRRYYERHGYTVTGESRRVVRWESAITAVAGRRRPPD